MARINIEDGLFKDRRFINLCIKLGCVHNALGALVMVWVKAQKYYLKNSGIPDGVWVEQQLSEHVIDVGLAERKNGFVHVSGADKQFAWLKQRSDSGKKGGIASSKKRSSDRQATASKKPSGRQAGPSLSSPYSLLSSHITNSNNTSSAELVADAPIQAAEDLLSRLSDKAKQRLNHLYPDSEYLRREVGKMEIWLDANKHKAPRSKSGWSRFILGWLERGWEQHRKNLGSNKPPKEKKPDMWVDENGITRDAHGGIICGLDIQRDEQGRIIWK